MPAGGPHSQGSPERRIEPAEFGQLAAPSALMSSRWSRDNLVTSHPARLYDGTVVERIDQEALEYLLQDFVARRGPMRVRAGRMGVFSWDLVCEGEAGAFALQIPVAIDEPGRRARAKRDVPGLNVENARYFRDRGLTRFVVEPKDLLALAGGVPAALFEALPEHHPLTFGCGSLELKLADGWLAFGPGATAELLAEMIAALVYHYEPELDGGTAVTDVFVNDGDFAARRLPHGAFELRLTAVRRREPGIGPNLHLLYLIQLMAYEDFSVDSALTGLPLSISNPSVAFEGVVRGLRYRFRDLGRDEALGVDQARAWIHDFGRSREGRGYRPWVERFLAGALPLSFGGDLRERWWRLFPVNRKQSLLELRSRQAPDSPAAHSARALKTFLERLSREIGRCEGEPNTSFVNDLGREDLLTLLAQANVEPHAREAVAGEFFAHWPYRNLDQLVARVPGARGLRRLKGQLVFGRFVPAQEHGTLKALGAPPKDAPARPFANPEFFDALPLPAALAAQAAATFPSFEAYMDAALHDERWGYYAHHVVIGGAGHFITHPEELSPDYGAWLSTWAFKAWQEMIDRGELSETDAFPVIEFGAGNGRLARDFLDAVARAAARATGGEAERRRSFASRVEYRIYEMSASLREKQRALLGEQAVILEGDARRPQASLSRDFPDGLKGFVVTNEVPDAFGVHKVALSAGGHAFAALVVPRVEPELRAALSGDLALRVDAVNEAVRRTFGFSGHSSDRYLDGPTFTELMTRLAELGPERREALLSALWFEEAYVPASVVPDLATHLRENAAEYALALAAEDSGVVTYVNVHANGFIRELGLSLVAGFVVTIDYGDTTLALVQGARRGDFPFRVYGEWQEYLPRPNDPYAAPGTQDLTTDVNFTDLARAGQAAGLKLVHFGPERDVAGDALPELLDAGGSEALTKLIGNQGFKVLVLGTRPSDAFSSTLMTPLPLCGREQDIPKSRRARISAIEKVLSAT
ncbi:MAG TPA: SAM-dependent methyltransferase [Polyangiaceae bacterium]